MAFEKGREKTGGRKKGSTNKPNTDIRNAFKSLIEDNITTLTKDLKKLDAKDRVDAIIKLANFVIPKLQAVEQYEPTTLEEFIAMAPEERQAKIIEIKNRLNGRDRKAS